MRFWLVLVAVALLPLPAAALGPDEAVLSAGVGPTVKLQDGARAGAQLDLRLLRGLSDSWAARLGVEIGVLPSPAGQKTGTVVTQAVGATWAVDVVTWVPFVDLGLLAADVRGGGYGESQRLGAQLGLGADYLLSPRNQVSFLGRVDYLPLRVAGTKAPAPVQLSLVVHLGHSF